MPARARARPWKRYFLEMFTRDISLEDCILDLVDNSIDGLIRTKNIDLGIGLLATSSPPAAGRQDVPSINVEYSPRSFRISDNCGGIPYKDARDEIFNFGHSPDYDTSVLGTRLGVYGIGLKRALFKIGARFTMTSKALGDGFITSEDLDKWAERDEDLKDWSFPIQRTQGVKTGRCAGTEIAIADLREDVKMAMQDGMFSSSLFRAIATAYALFLERFVRVTVNGQTVEPIAIPFGGSDEVTPAYKEITYDSVSVKLFASIASRDASNQWPVDQAGWYVACNGRLVVVADKTDLTGWGGGDLPEFHGGKHRGFVGLALFQSSDPLSLPWKTTKKGLNKESMAYQSVRHHMTAVARPILTFLNKMYPTELAQEAQQRRIADEVQLVDVRTLASGREAPFTVTSKPGRKVKTTVRVQYDAENADVDRIRRHMRRPDASLREIGEVTFRYYMDNEGLT